MIYKLMGCILAATLIIGCGNESKIVGVWKATSVDMSFAIGKIPPEKMEEAKQAMLRESAPEFDLNSDGSARIIGAGTNCDGTWSVEENIVNVNCSGSFLRLEINGNKLTTLPDRTFSFERR